MSHSLHAITIDSIDSIGFHTTDCQIRTYTNTETRIQSYGEDKTQPITYFDLQLKFLMTKAALIPSYMYIAKIELNFALRVDAIYLR